VARALTQALVESAVASGIHDIETTCWSFNQGAQAALRRLGFTPKSLRFALEVT
jgi:RimJ/RimL family protein N-acetyltransferase